jgi:FkbM family methyltransferase
MYKRLRYFWKNRSQKIMTKTEIVHHNGQKYILHVPNYICSYRAKTFSTKEPETLSWIDTFEKGSVFWDVGANVGLYSIYASATKLTRTFAFEPSVFNLELLARNIFSNGLQESICLVPIPLNNRSGTSQFQLQKTDWGSALSTFEHKIDYTGASINSAFEYWTIGMMMDQAFTVFGIPFPDYLKIDVDGIEHLLLQKGDATLKNCREILIEYSGQWLEQAISIEAILSKHGFRKTLNHDFHPTLNPSGTMNTIWVK